MTEENTKAGQPSGPKSRDRPERTLRLRFLFGGYQDFALHELWQVLRHPYLMTYYLASMSVSFVLSFLFDERGTVGVGFTLLAPILVLATITGILSFAGWIHLVALVRRADEPVIVLISVPLILSIMAVTGTTTVLWNILLDVPMASATVTAITLAAVYAVDEFIIAKFLRPRSASIVEDVRSFRGTVPQRRPPLAAASAGANAPQIAAGSVRLAVTEVLRMQAQGNYVQIWTDTDAFLVPGPFSTLLTQTPDGLGCLVHRSEWVATRAVTSAERKGRVTEIRLVNGDMVRVASTRAGVVRDWLAQFGAKPSRRRAQSTG